MDDSRSRVRLTVLLTGNVPTRLAEGEVIGVGVDVFGSGGQESDYQVFLDGGAQGWRAFLQTPRGFVRFPGTFVVADRRLIAELPWSGFGGRVSGRVAAFADWSAGDAIGSSSRDRAPDSGTHRFIPD